MKILQPLSHQTKYRPDIDGLRAIAVLSVLAFHAFPEWMGGGFIGVDVFFVISGYLISTILHENLQRGTFSFSEFYARRIKRIFPGLLFILVASYTLAWFVLLANEYKQLGKHIASGAGFISNFVLWSEAGYFDTSADKKPLLHLWSLGIEEQFYIFWPFILWIASKRKLSLTGITFIIAVISFWLNIRGIKENAVATFYSPLTRFWELLCGGLLASLQTKFFQKKFENVLSTIGLILLTFGFWRIHGKLSFPGVWAFVPVLGTLLIISAGKDAWFNRKVLSNRFLVWIGLISFPLYLWHWPLLSFARIIENGVIGVNVCIFAIALSFLLAWVTYRFIERPIRLGNWENTRVVSVLVALMVVIAGAGYRTYYKDGYVFRFSHELEAQRFFSDIPGFKRFDCGKIIPELAGFSFDGDCQILKDSAPSIAFIGDSHTSVYLGLAMKYFSNESVMMTIQTSCLPFSFDGFFSVDCKRKAEALASYIQSSASLKTVILSGYWAYLMAGGFGQTGEGWRTPKPLSKDAAKSFEKNAKHILSILEKSGKQIVLIKDVPWLDFDINTCMNVRPFSLSSKKQKEDCFVGYKRLREENAPYDAVLNRVLSSFPKVKVYDPHSLFCSEDKCLVKKGSRIYYYDSDHLSGYGADLLLRDLVTKIKLKAGSESSKYGELEGKSQGS